ncbi:MAG: imelysin family protein [Bacteroidia bacterium]|nr:imelysin family protein [Bacteroidia bacterium]
MKSHILFLFSVLIVASVISCKKEDKDDQLKDQFDRKAMLENIGNNIIVPNYLSLKTKIAALETAVTAFSGNSDSANLVNVQNSFKEAYRSWQLCSVFEFGPADQEMLRANLNTFPTDTSKINSNIVSGTYDLTAVASRDAKGFPALDYLFFGTGTGFNAILATYTTDSKAAGRRNYMSALMSEIKTKVNAVYNAWTAAGGNYIATFAANTGSGAGSSIGMLVNQIVFDWDILRNGQIGIPLGKKTLGTPLPEKVEGYYSKISVELALKHYKAIEDLFSGKDGSGNDGKGMDDYLTYFDAHPLYTSGSLSDAIKAQFTLVGNKLQLIPDPLSGTILTNSALVENAYIEIQKAYILLKTDMPSAMGLTIDQDPDGD